MPKILEEESTLLLFIKKIIGNHYLTNAGCNVIYEIANSPTLRQCVKYNGVTDKFEIPVSILEENGITAVTRKWISVSYLCKTSEHTSYIIHFSVDALNNFCFNLEEKN